MGNLQHITHFYWVAAASHLQKYATDSCARATSNSNNHHFFPVNAPHAHTHKEWKHFSKADLDFSGSVWFSLEGELNKCQVLTTKTWRFKTDPCDLSLCPGAVPNTHNTIHTQFYWHLHWWRTAFTFFFSQLHILTHLLTAPTRHHAQIHAQVLITRLTDCVNLNPKKTLPVQADPPSCLDLKLEQHRQNDANKYDSAFPWLKSLGNEVMEINLSKDNMALSTMVPQFHPFCASPCLTKQVSIYSKPAAFSSLCF